MNNIASKAIRAALPLVLAFPLCAAPVLLQPSQAMAQQVQAPNVYLQAALDVASAIDRYEMAAVWEAASTVMKSSTPLESFIANTAQRRAQLGSVRNREWMSVMRVPIATNEGTLPAGQYISIRFATTGSNGKVMDEAISFRQDTDGRWRLVGYTLN